MKTLAEIETAAKKLPPLEREKLVLSLSSTPRAGGGRGVRARTRRLGGDCLLEAPADAPPMTPERIKQLLEGKGSVLDFAHSPLRFGKGS